MSEPVGWDVTMRPGNSIVLAAMLCLMAAGWLLRVSPVQRRQLVGLGLLGAALIGATQAIAWRAPRTAQVVGDWLPCLLMLIVYWQAGRFLGTPGSPNQKLQAWLVSFDSRWLSTLLDRWIHGWSGTWIGSFFELAYLLCYPLIPAGVGILYWTGQRGAIDEYWTLVLSASCICYLCLPFTQTLPPRLLPSSAGAEPARISLRRFNLVICRRASIHLNTFPSAHVASATAASMVVMRYAPGPGVVLLLIALGITIGAVLGRYHYALDVIFGAALPLVIAVCYWL